jgi:hypothetical protein
MRRLVLLASLLALLGVAFSTPAQAARPLTTLTFGELPFQPVDGLSFSGVTFGFEIGGVPSGDAVYNGLGPGVTTYVQDPSLEGSAFGTLTLQFDHPTTILRFGIARNCVCTLTPGVSVQLFSPGGQHSQGQISLPTTSLGTFSEALFSYVGPAIQTAVITFPSANDAGRFALDNLTFASVGGG